MSAHRGDSGTQYMDRKEVGQKGRKHRLRERRKDT
jgi:hypothetical protein